MECTGEQFEMKTEEEEKENWRQCRMTVLMEEERAVFLNAACTSAGADVLCDSLVDHNPMWTDLVWVGDEEWASLGRWRIRRLTGIAGVRTCFDNGHVLMISKQLMPG